MAKKIEQEIRFWQKPADWLYRYRVLIQALLLLCVAVACIKLMF